MLESTTGCLKEHLWERAELSSRANYSILRCKLSPTLPKDLYGMTPPSPKPVSCPKHTINQAPVVDTTPCSVILPNKKSKTMAPAQLHNGFSLSEVSPSGMFSFCFDFSLLTRFISLGCNIISLFSLVAGHPYLDLIPALFVPLSCEELVCSLFLLLSFP